MPEFTLTAKSPLDGFNRDYDGANISEVTGRAIVSIATPLGGDAKLAKALSSSYGAEIPAVGQTVTSSQDNACFLGLAKDQMFVLFDHPGTGSMEVVSKNLKETAYLTDQSDSWAMIRLSGSKSRAALERICPINLEPAAFPEGSVARTHMEHLGVIIVHEEPDTFLLMSARSSSASFLEAVETSVHNVI